jgi:hypothetical protein
MIVIDQTLISNAVVEEQFVCDLLRCKGACCEEGDFGAPLEEAELQRIQDNLEGIKPFMTEAGRKLLEQESFFEPDDFDQPVTTTIQGRDCVFAVRDNSILSCAIEKAWKAGMSDFQKPISCHLYPIRIQRHTHYEAVNYHEWNICSPACENGKALKMPVYRFLKAPLIRKYGEEWFQQLEAIAIQLNEGKP